MGRRSRKRGVGEGLTAPPPERPPARKRTFGDRILAAADERPKPPWHPFPLVELCVLAGIVLMVWGLLEFEDRNGRVLLAMGLVLASLGGLDTAAREHFGGFRSHTLLLAGVPAVLGAGALFFARAPWPVVAAAAIVLFGGAVWLLRSAFRRRTGGVSFKA